MTLVRRAVAAGFKDVGRLEKDPHFELIREHADFRELVAKLKAGGDFAALAAQYSKDPVSATKGGDLDWAGRDTFEKPFEDAVFSMSKGELRGPIKGQFGYHLIRLDDTEGGQTKSFTEARAELEKDYRTEKAEALFYEQSQKLGDEAFKALTELGPVAAALNLPVQKVAGFTRQGGGLFGAEPKIIEAAFQEASLAKGENSALLALGEDRAVVLRVAAHQPPVQLHMLSDGQRSSLNSRDAMTARAGASMSRASLTGASLGGSCPSTCGSTGAKHGIPPTPA